MRLDLRRVTPQGLPAVQSGCVAVLKSANLRSEALLKSLGCVAGDPTVQQAHRDDVDELVMEYEVASAQDANGRVLISSTEAWCGGMRRIFERLAWRKVGQIAEVNKDGSTEWFHAISLGA